MGTNNTEATRTVAKPFRILIEQMELALRFGSQEELESTCNELLSQVKYDTFEAGAKLNNSGETELISFSSNPEVVYQKLLEYRKEGTGAYLNVTCGHCGNEDRGRSISSWGMRRSHTKWLLDNFPKEI